jgi:hypothetical protein
MRNGNYQRAFGDCRSIAIISGAGMSRRDRRWKFHVLLPPPAKKMRCGWKILSIRIQAIPSLGGAGSAF